MISKKIDPNHSIFLNICRGLAATMVLAIHLRGHFFDTYANLQPEYQNTLNYLLFFITRIGHECVMVFFVLSGYLVGGNYLIDVINKTSNWKKYLLDRLTRMWIVLIPALLIGFALDYFRCIQINDSSLTSDWSTINFIGNVFFVQTIFVPIFTSNGALWSLANEFWYYLIFPLILIPFKTIKSILFKISLSAFVLILFYFIMPSIIQLFPIWLLGVLIRFIRIPEILKKRIWAPLIYVLFIISIYYSNTQPQLFTHYLVGITFAVLILYHQNNQRINFTGVKKFASLMSNFSFSIYSFHMPILFLTLASIKLHWGFDIRYKEAGLLEWAIYLCLLISILVVIYLLYLVTERNTYKCRDWLRLKLAFLKLDESQK